MKAAPSPRAPRQPMMSHEKGVMAMTKPTRALEGKSAKFLYISFLGEWLGSKIPRTVV